jgi:hypothetical protein
MDRLGARVIAIERVMSMGTKDEAVDSCVVELGVARRMLPELWVSSLEDLQMYSLCGGQTIPITPPSDPSYHMEVPSSCHLQSLCASHVCRDRVVLL